MKKVFHDSETSAHGQQVITACACIMRQDAGEWQMLLCKRAATKKFLPGVFEVPGGHIDFGEDIVEGLQREIMEELEVEIVVKETVHAFTYLNEIKGAHAVEVLFLAELADAGAEIAQHPEDHSEFVWASSERAEELYAAKEEDMELVGIRRAFERAA